MSLKVFHIVFIACSFVLGVFFSWWNFNSFLQTKQGGYLLGGIASLLGTIALLIYGYFFSKKIKNY